MLALIKAQVWKYKCIEDSTPVLLADDVTVLVGKNESGKTAFLEALHKALPVGSPKYDFIYDYPTLTVSSVWNVFNDATTVTKEEQEFVDAIQKIES